MTTANTRIRYTIARDQFDRELEMHFKLAHYGLTKDLAFPSARMVFWEGIMERMLRNGWVKR